MNSWAIGRKGIKFPAFAAPAPPGIPDQSRTGPEKDSPPTPQTPGKLRVYHTPIPVPLLISSSIPGAPGFQTPSRAVGKVNDQTAAFAKGSRHRGASPTGNGHAKAERPGTTAESAHPKAKARPCGDIAIRDRAPDPRITWGGRCSPSARPNRTTMREAIRNTSGNLPVKPLRADQVRAGAAGRKSPQAQTTMRD